MSQSILQGFDVSPKSIGQTVTSKHGFISLYDFDDNVLERIFPDVS